MRVCDDAYLQSLPSPDGRNYIVRQQKDKSFLACAKLERAFDLTFQRRGYTISTSEKGDGKCSKTLSRRSPKRS
jgi:hypothetical protein